MKYGPEFPERFGSIEAAGCTAMDTFTNWYNHEHRHTGIGLHTPADVHFGRATAMRRRRGIVLNAAYAAHPERFVRNPPEPPALPTTTWINKPPAEEENPTP